MTRSTQALLILLASITLIVSIACGGSKNQRPEENVVNMEEIENDPLLKLQGAAGALVAAPLLGPIESIEQFCITIEEDNCGETDGSESYGIFMTPDLRQTFTLENGAKVGIKTLYMQSVKDSAQMMTLFAEWEGDLWALPPLVVSGIVNAMGSVMIVKPVDRDLLHIRAMSLIETEPSGPAEAMEYDLFCQFKKGTTPECVQIAINSMLLDDIAGENIVEAAQVYTSYEPGKGYSISDGGVEDTSDRRALLPPAGIYQFTFSN